jgi:hypothetical protein
MEKSEVTPEDQFDTEISAVFIRWFEESDLTEVQMSRIALEVVERFCDTEIEFEMDFDLEETDEE